ncbi:MAG: hypothetical protein MUC51_13710 [Anaerolineae bacterium]|jgi:hypothetical protein|nr:hypothetical protein [Anaerolineae bacterium]
MSINLDPKCPLAPSELVLLHSQQFTGKTNVNTEDLLNGNAKKLAKPLGEAILTTAFLASEEIGAIRLEVEKGKKLLMFSSTKLLVTSNNSAVAWPAGSLESTISSARKNRPEAHEVVHDWLGRDNDDPWSLVIDKVRDGLAQRQLLDITKEKVLVVLSTKHYELPESTGVLAAQQPVGPIQQLLSECKQARPELWTLLLSQAQKGVNRRVPPKDSSDE